MATMKPPETTKQPKSAAPSGKQRPDEPITPTEPETDGLLEAFKVLEALGKPRPHLEFRSKPATRDQPHTRTPLKPIDPNNTISLDTPVIEKPGRLRRPSARPGQITPKQTQVAPKLPRRPDTRSKVLKPQPTLRINKPRPLRPRLRVDNSSSQESSSKEPPRITVPISAVKPEYLREHYASRSLEHPLFTNFKSASEKYLANVEARQMQAIERAYAAALQVHKEFLQHSSQQRRNFATAVDDAFRDVGEFKSAKETKLNADFPRLRDGAEMALGKIGPRLRKYERACAQITTLNSNMKSAEAKGGNVYAAKLRKIEKAYAQRTEEIKTKAKDEFRKLEEEVRRSEESFERRKQEEEKMMEQIIRMAESDSEEADDGEVKSAAHGSGNGS